MHKLDLREGKARAKATQLASGRARAQAVWLWTSSLFTTLLFYYGLDPPDWDRKRQGWGVACSAWRFCHCWEEGLQSAQSPQGGGGGRFQEGSLPLTALVSRARLRASFTRQRKVNPTGESLPVGFTALAALAIRDWLKLVLIWDRSLTLLEGQRSTLRKVRDRTDLSKREASGPALGTERTRHGVEY